MWMHSRQYNSETCATEMSIIDHRKKGASESSLYNRSEKDSLKEKGMQSSH